MRNNFKPNIKLLFLLKVQCFEEMKNFCYAFLLIVNCITISIVMQLEQFYQSMLFKHHQGINCFMLVLNLSDFILIPYFYRTHNVL